jgi:DNA-binding PadR family transcriptional regulator
MPSASFHILLSLIQGPRHGYAIMLDVVAQTEGAVKLGAGTLYGSIKKLLEKGLIRETGEGDDRRRFYELTDSGRDAVLDEAARLERTMKAVHRVLGVQNA